MKTSLDCFLNQVIDRAVIRRWNCNRVVLALLILIIINCDNYYYQTLKIDINVLLATSYDYKLHHTG